MKKNIITGEPCETRLVDTKQRVYRNVDTSDQRGEWVEENAYNKGYTKGVKVGNWFEEQALRETHLQLGNTLSASNYMMNSLAPHLEKEEKLTRPSTTAKVIYGAHSDKILFFDDAKEIKPKQTKPTGLFIPQDINDKDHANPMNSTYRNTFHPPALESNAVGRRQQLLEKELLEKAAQDIQEKEDEKTLSFKQGVLKETYQTTYGKEINEKLSSIKSTTGLLANKTLESPLTYHKEEPITIYTETIRNQNHNAKLLQTRIYHTKPSETGSPFAKNSKFSMPISEYKDDTTKRL
ncbi:hypothetical protein ABK040_006607 [Willaertia magna]